MLHTEQTVVSKKTLSLALVELMVQGSGRKAADILLEGCA